MTLRCLDQELEGCLVEDAPCLTRSLLYHPNLSQIPILVVYTKLVKKKKDSDQVYLVNDLLLLHEVTSSKTNESSELYQFR